MWKSYTRSASINILQFKRLPLSAAKLFTFRILTEKKYCQIKLQRLQKVETHAFGFLVLQINSL